MKKFTYLAATLLVMAGAVSCKKNAEVKEPAPQPTGVMRHVTVSAAGQGTAKTSVVSGGTLIWSNDDQLNIVPTSGGFDAVALAIKNGAGTSSGTFEGSIDSGIEDNTPLYGWAGGAWTYNSGSFTVDMPITQTYVEDGLAKNAYPSIGTGTIENGISLGNPFGVLCLIVKGETTDKVKSITLTSTAKNLAGVFTVNPNNYTVTSGSSKTITLNCAEAVALATDGVNFRIVVPAASYTANDLTVTVTKSDDTTFKVKLGATTVTANNVTKVSVVEPVRPECQKALDDASNWVKIGEQYWLKENAKCIEYDTNSEAYNASWLTNNTISTISSSAYNPWCTAIPDASVPEYLKDQSDKLGMQYNWAAAVGVSVGQQSVSDPRQGICPNGSHIPSISEWQTLNDYIETTDGKGERKAGIYLKASKGWAPGTGTPGTDEYGFGGLPAGFDIGGGNWKMVGENGNYWSTKMAMSPVYAYNPSLVNANDELNVSSYCYKNISASVRCLKD
ncbi:MAG: fibrobacter succinogenes major paralogous domain-containing protein [Paludibacteraceae bacterium]|nr:fibrobacter succinogenes major paralogous domain-containing protein [Paludibacteraceae bacterium]